MRESFDAGREISLLVKNSPNRNTKLDKILKKSKNDETNIHIFIASLPWNVSKASSGIKVKIFHNQIDSNDMSFHIRSFTFNKDHSHSSSSSAWFESVHSNGSPQNVQVV